MKLSRIILATALSAFATHALAGYKTEKITDNGPRFEMTVEYPQTGNAGVDADLRDFATGFATDFIDMKQTAATDTNLPEGSNYSGELTFEVARDDDAVFSVRFTWASYTGGAHPNSSLFGLNYLKSAGRRITVEELLGPKGLKAAAAIVQRQLEQKLIKDEASDKEWIERGAAPLPENFEAYTWYTDRLLFSFSAYQVAAYAAGPQEASIPLTSVKGFMRPDPLAPLASFDCAAAKSAVETAICSDWRIARVDRSIAESYRGKLTSAADEAEKSKIRDDQRTWIKQRDLCNADSGPRLLPCVRQKQEQRLKDLKAPSS